MGGEGSGRKPDPVKALIRQTQEQAMNIGTSGAPIALPNYSGIKKEAFITNAATIGIPSQSGQNGKYLSTDGSVLSWQSAPTEIPTQTGNNGKYLTTNGSVVSWGTVAGGSPAGSSGYVQYNSSGSFGAEEYFSYNPTTRTLTLKGVAGTTTGIGNAYEAYASSDGGYGRKGAYAWYSPTGTFLGVLGGDNQENPNYGAFSLAGDSGSDYRIAEVNFLDRAIGGSYPSDQRAVTLSGDWDAGNSTYLFKISKAGVDYAITVDCNNRRLGVANNSPTYTLDVGGTINASGGFYSGGTQGYTGTLRDSNNNAIAEVSGGIITSVYY